MAAPGIQVAADEHVFLKGRPPLAEYLGFVTLQTIEGGAADYRQLSDEWRTANDHIRELEEHEVGWANDPVIGAVPAELQPMVGNVLRDPAFQRSFAIVPAEMGMVELDRLVVYQKHINLTYIRELRQTLGPAPNQDLIFRVCLPFDHPHPNVRYMQVANNVFVFTSPSNDFRFVESRLFDPAQVANYVAQGPVSGVIGLVVGYGSNYLNVIHAENRLILGNGSHRAFALREAGITHVPAVIQRVSRREELNVIASAEVQANPDSYLTAPRPPLLKDYFDAALRKIVTVPRRFRQVKISFGVEQIDVPAT